MRPVRPSAITSLGPTLPPAARPVSRQVPALARALALIAGTTALTLLAIATPGCASTTPITPTPAVRLHAMQQAVTDRAGADRAATDAGTADMTQLAALVEDLDSDDPAVRMAAAGALRRLTGRNDGYRHDDPAARREEAVERWILFVDQADGGKVASPNSPAGPASASGRTNHG